MLTTAPQYHLINIDDQEAALGSSVPAPAPPAFKPNWGDTLVYLFVIIFFVSLTGIVLFMLMVPYMDMNGPECMVWYVRGRDWHDIYGPVAPLPMCAGSISGLTPFQAAQCCKITTPGGVFPTPGGAIAIVFALCVAVFIVTSCILVGAGAVLFTLTAIAHVYEHRVVIVKVLGITLALISMIVGCGYAAALVVVIALRLLN